MDIISHGLWGATIARRQKLLIPALISGSLPDLISTVAGFIYLQIAGGPSLIFDWSTLPNWSRTLYGYSHSLIGLIIFSILIIIFAHRCLILILPFTFHIFLDLFTHADDPLARLFYPFINYSSQRIWGFNWWEKPWTSVINWALIIGINLGFIIYRQKKNLSNKSTR